MALEYADCILVRGIKPYQKLKKERYAEYDTKLHPEASGSVENVLLSFHCYYDQVYSDPKRIAPAIFRINRSVCDNKMFTNDSENNLLRELSQ